MKKRLAGAALASCMMLPLLTGSALGAGEHPFTDVPLTHWANIAVQYVYDKNLMGGVTDTTFAPEGTTTRGQIVVILHRLEGEPAAERKAAFTDVADGAWYAAGVAWAAENGIVNGDEAGRFRPDAPLTREQLAAILYRYAQFKEYDVSARSDLSKYADADTVSAYAQEPMSWVNAERLITGLEDTRLAPTGQAQRAQVAMILNRFCEWIIPSGPSISDNQMVQNLLHSDLRKNETLAIMADVMIQDGLDPAFIAGVLGNIIEEGDCGLFESSNYTNQAAKPAYLQYMDDNYDYRNKYSYKRIYDEGMSLTEVYNMVQELGPAGANGRGSCFGLGCFQWTDYTRLSALLDNYMEAANGASTITKAQVQLAEGKTISDELMGRYNWVYTNWQSEVAGMTDMESARQAGVRVCISYGVPMGYNTEAVQTVRGNRALEVYAVMTGQEIPTE